jgi:hypothetical protein
MDKKRKIDDITKGNCKSFIADGMTTNEIRKNVSYIREFILKGGSTSLTDRIELLKISHVSFYERYPVLFDMCTRKDFDMNQLNYFLEKREQVVNDEVSSEELSKQIGKEMFEKYVDISKLNEKKP